MHTSWQTSVSREAVRSLISLWRIDGKPPRGQDRECSTVKLVPHTQLVGIRSGGQPYLRASASAKAPLCKQKPCSLMGSVVNQLDSPLSFSLVHSVLLQITLKRSRAPRREISWNQCLKACFSSARIRRGQSLTVLNG